MYALKQIVHTLFVFKTLALVLFLSCSIFSTENLKVFSSVSLKTGIIDRVPMRDFNLQSNINKNWQIKIEQRSYGVLLWSNLNRLDLLAGIMVKSWCGVNGGLALANSPVVALQITPALEVWLRKEWAKGWGLSLQSRAYFFKDIGLNENQIEADYSFKFGLQAGLFFFSHFGYEYTTKTIQPLFGGGLKLGYRKWF